MLNRRRCDGLTRRSALELGLGGFLGTSFVGGLKARAESQHDPARLVHHETECSSRNDPGDLAGIR